MSLTPEQIAYMQEHASDDQRTGIIAFGVICSIAAIVAVGSRFVARPTSKSKVGLDDWFITVGLIITISYVISYCPTTKYGMSRHVIFVTDLHGFAASIQCCHLDDQTLSSSSLWANFATAEFQDNSLDR
ncbi:hypothetical protein BELL_0111g00080 [Botrytis elliptica]|uniref:Uncharacterized protein n=1 Tax=Botrytis elliptica TaxID=278938 RepID=A0A4Z1K7V6_9HELO|nr:hypothetical protein BELL_0111g00080 [Botrytis elliptica]